MLAEKRSKANYHAAVTLRKGLKGDFMDHYGFGARMLEKMGWSKGKGLGLNSDGEVNPIAIKMKSDNKGLGFARTSEDIAVAQQQGFDALLASFSEGTDEKKLDSDTAAETEAAEVNAPKSLEQMSKKSRARVHYQKFTRGKDLSRASSKDLASILGVGMFNPKPSSEPERIPDVGPPIPSARVLYSGSGTTTTDYFKKKYEEKKRKMEASDFENGATKTSTFVDTSSVNLDVMEENDGNNSFTEENDGSSNDPKKMKKKKKKTDKSSETDIPLNTSILNSTMNEDGVLSSNSRRKSVTWGEVEVSFVSKYIKDMVDTSGESVNGDLPSETSNTSDDTTVVECEKKKKRKKSKKDKEIYQTEEISEGAGTEDLNMVPDQLLTATISEHSFDLSNKKKKKKKSKGEKEETSACNSQGSVGNESLKCDITDDGLANDRKIKKRKKKMAIDEAATVCESVSLNCNGTGENFECGVSGKKKKKSEHVLDEDTGVPVVVASSSESKKKRKRSEDEESPTHSEPVEGAFEKKKKKKKSHENDNRRGEENAVEITFTTSSVNCTGTPEEKKKKETVENETSGNIANIVEKSKKRSAQSGNENGEEKALSNDLVVSETIPEEGSKKKKKKNRKEPGDNTEKPVNDQKPLTCKLTFNKPTGPHVIEDVRDYNHKRVYAALGCNVKEAVEKTITLQVPPTGFSGSNLDEILGYGQAFKLGGSC